MAISSSTPSLNLSRPFVIRTHSSDVGLLSRPTFQIQKQRSKQLHFQLQAVSRATQIPLNIDYLKSEFGGHGVGFESIGDSCVLKLRTENGSLANLVLPRGIVTSYRPHMWHGANMEVIHTTVSENENGESVIKGGISMDFKCWSESGESWCPRNWHLHGIRASPDKSVQVELFSVSPVDSIEIRCVMTLHSNRLTLEFRIENPNPNPLYITGSIINHLKVSTPDATYTVGMQGSTYCTSQPVQSEFGMVPPGFGQTGTLTGASGNMWAQRGLDGLFSLSRSEVRGEEREEESDYASMTEESCRIYKNAPRQFSFIDRGRRNSVALGSSGFNEIYILSPGSSHEWYGKYAYVSVGPTMLNPFVVGPNGGVWQGAQYLHNPNL